MNSVPSPAMPVMGRISADKSQLGFPLWIFVPGCGGGGCGGRIDTGKKGEEMLSSPGKIGKQTYGRNYISTLF